MTDKDKIRGFSKRTEKKTSNKHFAVRISNGSYYYTSP